ncbi:MAG: rod shape-determining protein MreD [Gemmatimonadaceae bacterium]
MKPSEVVRTLIAFAMLVVLHFTVRPLLAWRASPDFLVIALLLVAIRVRPGSAAVVGFFVGLVTDSLSLHAFGAGALSMSVVAFVASWLKAVFFADDLSLNAFFFFLGKWAFDLLYLVVARQPSSDSVLMQMLVWFPLSAAVTALAGVATLLVLRPMLRRAPA